MMAASAPTSSRSKAIQEFTAFLHERGFILVDYFKKQSEEAVHSLTKFLHPSGELVLVENLNNEGFEVYYLAAAGNEIAGTREAIEERIATRLQPTRG